MQAGNPTGNLLIVMALPRESRGLLEAAGATVLYTGIGKVNAEQMMGAGDPFPATQIQRQVNDRKRRFETADGRFQFRSDLKATWNAIDGALASASSRIYAAGGGIAEYGGWGLSFLTGEPWFAGVGGCGAMSARRQQNPHLRQRRERCG